MKSFTIDTPELEASVMPPAIAAGGMNNKTVPVI